MTENDKKPPKDEDRPGGKPEDEPKPTPQGGTPGGGNGPPKGND